jgi:aldehyde:ferredoxin oxidoreductase
MARTFGWAGTVLFVDLSTGEITKVATADYRPEEFIGGLGLAARIFWELGCPEVAAYHPDNPLIISTGPLTGIYGPFGKGLVCSISPQSYPKELFNYSSFGGRFSTELKHAGYDVLVVLGKSETPVYLSIRDEDVVIKSADAFWGLETFETQQMLLANEAGASILTIGPAGENLSRVSVILNETNSAAGQGGFGAVMGSKNLKAIAVRGSGAVYVSRARDIMQLSNVITSENNGNAGLMSKVFRVPYTSPEETQEIFINKYYIKQHGCYGCPQQCQSVNFIPGIGLSGSKCANWGWSPLFSDAPEDIWQANVSMQKLGINSFDMTNGIPLLLKLAYQDGILSTSEIEEDIGLPATRWLGGRATDHEFMEVLFNKVANGEIPYSEGTPRFTGYFRQKLHRGEELMNLQRELYTAHGYAYHHVDNLGSALHWATDSRDPLGSAHEYRDPPQDVMEYFGLPPYSSYQILDTGKTVYKGTELVTAWVQENQCLKNSLTVCEFWSHIKSFYSPPELNLWIVESELFSAVTGFDMDVEKLARAGERIWNLRRAIMVKRENRTREGDIINEPYFKKAITCYGGSMLGKKNMPIDRGKFEALKDRYYRLRGWDTGTGWPKREKLEELGLKDVADGLASVGKLP